MDKIAEGIEHLKNGGYVVIYDGDEREGEADLAFHASFATGEKMYRLRKDAGGMIVLAIGKEIAHELHLPFLHDIFTKAGIANTYVKTNYKDTPPYTIPVNHVNAHTGVTDNDKALAIKEFSRIFEHRGAESRKAFFESKFRTPGHLPICVSKSIEHRHGHTELAIELAKRGKMSEAMVLCEMLGRGTALNKKQATDYAKKNMMMFIEGKEIYGR